MKTSILRALILLPLLVALPVTAQEPNFGRAVALDGDDLIIGQPVNWYGPGTVYAYTPGPDGAWIERSLLTAPDSARKDDFGRAVSLDGDRLAVGAPRKLDGNGVVYLFERSGAGADWSAVGRIEPAGMGGQAEFGAALALAGDDLLIGSPEANGTGVVHHYRLQGQGWSMVNTLAPADEGAEAFGSTLSRAGDRVLIGAPSSAGGRGSVYMAERTDGGWTAPEALTLPAGLGERAGAGAALLLLDRGAVVGAPGDDAAFVLSEGPTGWTVTDELTPPSEEWEGDFGFAVAEAGGELWVGAPDAAGGDGRVFRFTPDGSGGYGEAVRVDPDQTDGTSWRIGFGYALAADGDRVVAGMPTRDFGEGRAMAFSRAGGSWDDGQVLEGRIFRLGEGLATGDRCVDGMMDEFPCTDIELVAHVPIEGLGGERGVWVNDVWGWEDPETGRRYALVARRDGASFVDVTDPAAPRLIGNLPRTEGSRPSVWRDIKTIGNHAFIVSDGAGAHGMQVFDLTRLRDVTGAPVEFEPETTYHEIFSAHNVVADTASGYVYIVGAGDGGNTCGGGLHMVDVRDPENPTFAGCYSDASGTGRRGYTHDAQCLVYDGPDEEYVGRQICLGSNASELNIADVTDKSNPVTISRATYPNVSYAHQGWLDDEHRYFYMNDEADENAGVVDRTRTLVWDLTELEDPVLVKEYFGPVPASDHNLFVTGDRMYQSNYGSGLRVLDISDRGEPREIAHFDSAPMNNDEPGFSAAQSGAWSNYPFFGDGLVIFTSVREGLFIVRVDRPIM